MDNHYLIKVLNEKINVSNKIQGNNASASTSELNQKINTLSVIVLALAKILERKGISKAGEINSLIEAAINLDENNDGKTDYGDVLAKFGFNTEELESIKRLNATKRAVRNRKLRNLDKDLY